MASVLTLNAGSSSLKFAVFDVEGGAPMAIFRGQIEGLGGNAVFSVRGRSTEMQSRPTGSGSHSAALREILDFIGGADGARSISAIGHRVVHGGVQFSGPVIADSLVLDALRVLMPMAPLHQPHNIACIEAARQVFPQALQVACFDTAFHRTHGWLNDIFALPPEYYDAGIRRYGFHGLAFEHLVGELRRIAPDIAEGRVILAHLGNGASVCAVRGGLSVSSTMNFTPLDGLPMGTRCGQLDPGVVLYLMEERRMAPSAIRELLYKESGLKGMSGVSHDVREIAAAGTPQAFRALDYFVHRVRREIGSLAAELGGLDAIVFSGGIGEHAHDLRSAICSGFEWLGLKIDSALNDSGARVFSFKDSPVKALTIPADEETTIAQHVLSVAMSWPALGFKLPGFHSSAGPGDRQREMTAGGARRQRRSNSRSRSARESSTKVGRP